MVCPVYRLRTKNTLWWVLYMICFVKKKKGKYTYIYYTTMHTDWALLSLVINHNWLISFLVINILLNNKERNTGNTNSSKYHRRIDNSFTL